MRALFLWVYFLIVGCFIGAFYLIDYLSDDAYRTEFREGYVAYAQRIAPFIVADINATQDIDSTLEHWQSIVGEELFSLKVIALPEEHQQSGKNVIVAELSVTEFSDEIRLLVPAQFAETINTPARPLALEFYFVDAYSEALETWYLSGIFAVYLFMAAVIGLLIWILYRYLQNIKFLTSSVIAGDLKARMNNTRIPMLQELSEDINHMAQELENKHQENEVFLGAIHHELRSPLTKLRLALDMILHQQCRTDYDAKNEQLAVQKELLADMDADLEELNALMEDILMLSRLRLQDTQLETQKLNIVEVVQTISDKFSDDKLNFNSSEVTEILANRVFLERAITNIISNALKFANHCVDISINQQNSRVSIIISDDGPGIPESEQQLIFKPFYRVDKGRARLTGGVGLGLAIARLVVVKMKGDIEVKSSPSGGACFVISLPPHEDMDNL